MIRTVKKPRILMVISKFYPLIGGAEQQCQRLSKELIRRGFDVKVVTGWRSRSVPKREVVDGIPIFRNHTLWEMFGFRRGTSLIYMCALLPYLIRCRKQYDVIHIHQVLNPAFIGVLVGKLLNKPTIAKTGSSGVTSDVIYIQKSLFGKSMFKFIRRYLNILVATSRRCVDDFLSAGFDPQHIRLIPNGVQLSESKKSYTLRNPSKLITVTRLSWEKGIDILLQAFGKVRQGEVHILGDGPLRQELHKLADNLGITNQVIFHGQVSDVAERLPKADIFVLSSRAEGMSNALLEAMAAGLPCIATSVGGNIDLLAPELLKDNSMKIPHSEFFVGSAGILVNSEDAEGLAKAIEYLYSDESLREQLGKATRERVELGYSIEAVAKRYIEIYNELSE